ncbi:MAG: response regulator [Nitrospirae bacterium]|nr:response regulator [Nitrospirota bacterium]
MNSSASAEGPSPPGNPVGRLLVVDDDIEIRTAVCELLRPLGFSIHEEGTVEGALRYVRGSPPDLILLDLHLPDRSGNDVVVELRSDPRTRLLPIIMLTGAGTRRDKIHAIESGATDFLSKPFSSVELIARVRSLIQLKFFTDDLDQAEQVIISLARSIDARDAYTARHSERVSELASRLAKRVGLPDTAQRSIRRGALLHDLGKISIRDSILLKPGPLTPAEYKEIQQHPLMGRDLIGQMNSLRGAVPVVLAHHERLDGSGYPQGLSDNAISIEARIVTIADIYDAITSGRVYRKALSHEDAFGILVAEADKGWRDRRLLDEFRAVLEAADLKENSTTRSAHESPMHVVEVAL